MFSATNQEVAKILKEIAAFLEAEGVAFKPQAFERAALAIEMASEELAELYKRDGLKSLGKIPGVGRGIAERIEELFLHGRIKDYEKLKRKYPIKMEEITSVEGVGPKTAIKLYKKLKTRSIAELERAAKAGKIGKLPGFGEKSEKKILKGIEFLKKSGGREILGFILPAVREVENSLKSLKEIKKLTVCGSIRRMKETIGDIDILAVSEKPRVVMDYFASLPEVQHVYSKGETKTMVRLNPATAGGLDADLRVVKPSSYGAAVQYFTGSKEHNIALREIAARKGYKLNEYGLFKGKKIIAGEDEKDVYEKLGLSWIPPELRTNSGEIEAAQKGKLPKLIEYGSLRGDLQIQTNWTDGKNSIEEMALAAMEIGLEYIAITDHTKRLAMTGGLDEKKIIKQWKEIDGLNSKLKTQNSKFRILKSTECDILKDGSLDLPDKVLSRLDVVGVAVHSHFNLSRKEQTERIKKAISNKNVHILFHPTGRIINRRRAYEVDMDEIIKTAKNTGTILEIDAYPDRLDLKNEHVRKCTTTGIKMSISSDAHSTAHLQYLDFGVAEARRGWAKKSDIINVWSLDKMRKFLKKR